TPSLRIRPRNKSEGFVQASEEQDIFNLSSRTSGTGLIHRRKSNNWKNKTFKITSSCPVLFRTQNARSKRSQSGSRTQTYPGLQVPQCAHDQRPLPSPFAFRNPSKPQVPDSQAFYSHRH